MNIIAAISACNSRFDSGYFNYIEKGAYGYRRICEGLLIKYGVIFNHKKTARIMRKYGLKPYFNEPKGYPH